MGILSKLAFWKKQDTIGDLNKDIDMGKDLDLGGMNPDLGLGPEPGMGSSQDPLSSMPPTGPPPSQPQFPQQGFQPVNQPGNQAPPTQDQDFVNSKNLEVISSKLDALRASLDSINQRLANIEKIAQGEQEDHNKRRYY